MQLAMPLSTGPHETTTLVLSGALYQVGAARTPAEYRYDHIIYKIANTQQHTGTQHTHYIIIRVIQCRYSGFANLAICQFL